MNNTTDRISRSPYAMAGVVVVLLLFFAAIAIIFNLSDRPPAVIQAHAGSSSKNSPEAPAKNSPASSRTKPEPRPEPARDPSVKDALVLGPGSVENLAAIRRDARQKPKYSLYDDDYLIMPQASDAIGLSDDETAAVQNETQEMLKLLGQEITRSMKEVSVTDTGRSYHIDPFVEKGDAIFSDYMQRLIQLLGNERAWALVKSLPIEKIGGSCAVDVTVRNPDPEMIKGLTPEETLRCYAVEYQYTDTKGHHGGGGSGGLESYNKLFLDTMRIELP